MRRFDQRSRRSTENNEMRRDQMAESGMAPGELSGVMPSEPKEPERGSARTVSDDLIGKMIDFYRHEGGREISREKAVEAIHNLAALFKLLARMDREQKEQRAKDGSKPSADRDRVEP